ncbi:MAG: EAL domain-containing protein [Alphaproteobacteria bacterium]|nr:MAG: EAL domain-containing protein [Alphaproteobacteria bacterium]
MLYAQAGARTAGATGESTRGQACGPRRTIAESVAAVVTPTSLPPCRRGERTAGRSEVDWAARVLARQADDFLEAEHRQALAGAVEALQAVSPDLAQVEPKLIRVLERASGLKELRFETEPAGSARQVQSMLDAKGRIVGWFSWEAERPATAMMNRLLPLAASIAAGLIGFAALAMWQLGRLGFQLARSEQHAQKLESQDTLTGLPSHNHFFEVLDRALARRQADETLAFAVLDLDGFDEVNDALGYAGGDEVLGEMGKRLAHSLCAGATIGRLGSDEFALLIDDVDQDEALAAAEALGKSLARPFWINQVVQVSVSMGVTMAPRDGTTRDELTRRADLALRTAKRRRRGSIVAFRGEMEAEFHERRFLKREVARALATNAFDLHYQPIVSAEGGLMRGVEALLRWDHAARGFVPPSVFVPVAEQGGLIDELGEFALRRAISDAARWSDLYVSVNVSPVQMRNRAFIDVVSSILNETGFEPSRLVLEMTESMLIDNPVETTARLKELRALGVRLALDDFGSGYSSLSYLQKLPFDKLKIDRSFVWALDQSANGGVIVQAIVALGRALGMAVVVEGVETEEQRVLLRLAGCNEMQGYLFAKPAPRDAIDRLLEHARSSLRVAQKQIKSLPARGGSTLRSASAAS